MPNPRFLKTAERWMNKEIPEIHAKTQKKQSPVTPVHTAFSIDDILKGKTFYDSSIPTALKQALDYVGSKGTVASMPYLIAGKATADKDSYIWKDWFTALSEENVGIDKKGKFVKAGKPVLIVVHGGGILTPERINQAYSEGLTEQSAAKYTDKEFDNLLDGKLPDGKSIKIYTIEDAQKGNIIDIFGRYAIALDFKIAKATDSGYYRKKQFLENSLVFARAGTLEHLENYYEKAKDSVGDVGNHHRFKDIDSDQPQGRLLYLDDGYDGLVGDNDLDNDGRFVGVAPEAHGAKK